MKEGMKSSAGAAVSPMRSGFNLRCVFLGWVLALGLAASHSGFGQDVLLAPGAPAPEFRVGAWIKGEAGPALKKGKVHVIEFTIVGCGPCITAIPHLDAMHRRYAGDVNLISVFAGGDPAGMAHAKRLVRNYSVDISYPVAVDTPEAFMEHNWMRAANRTGFPSVFVIDRQGEIAWVGNPLHPSFDKIVDEVQQGTFDRIAYAVKEDADRKKAQEEYERFIKPASDAGHPEALKTALRFYDEKIELDENFLFEKLNLLLKHDEERAYPVLKEAMERRVLGRHYLVSIHNQSYRLMNPDWRTYRECCEYLFETGNKAQQGLSHLQAIADSYFLQDDFDGAIAAQRRVIEHLRQYNDDEESRALLGNLVENAEEVLRQFVQMGQMKQEGRFTRVGSTLDSNPRLFKKTVMLVAMFPSITEYNLRKYRAKGYRNIGPSMTLEQLYRLAYLDDAGHRGDGPLIIYDCKDVDRMMEYFIAPNEEWNKIKRFNYDLIVPSNQSSTAQVMTAMQKDLEEKVGFAGKVLDEDMPVWAVTLAPEALDRLRSKAKGPVGYRDMVKVSKEDIVINKGRLGSIGRALRLLDPKEFYKHPVILSDGDKGFEFDLWVKIPYTVNGALDLPALQSALKSQGIDLRRITQRMKVLRITDSLSG